MPRPQQFDRDDVLDKALDVFWKHGFEGTSVQDLVDATGLNRGSLYNTFGDKAALFAEVMERYRANSPTHALSAAAGDPSDRHDALVLIADFLNTLVQRARQDADHKGCLITNTSAKAGCCDPAIDDWLRDTLTAMESTLANVIKRGQARGEIHRDAGARALARFVAAAAQGINVMARTGCPPKALQDIADQTVRALRP